MQIADVIVLNALRFFGDTLVFADDIAVQHLLPLGIRKDIIVQLFQFFAKVCEQFFLRTHGKKFIPLPLQKMNKLFFLLLLALVCHRTDSLRMILRNNGAFFGFGYDVEIGHVYNLILC